MLPEGRISNRSLEKGPRALNLMRGDQLTKTIPLVSLGRGIGMHGATIDAEAKFSFGQRYLLLIAKP